MALFIAALAFEEGALIAGAKLGILVASALATLLGVAGSRGAAAARDLVRSAEPPQDRDHEHELRAEPAPAARRRLAERKRAATARIGREVDQDRRRRRRRRSSTS
jgi:hypothetical protein